MAMQRDTRSDLSPRKVAERLKQEGKQRLERGKSTAADQVESVASALKRASSELGGESTLGDYANQLADGIGRFGTRLREGSIEDLAHDMQAAARRNPGLFVFGGFALGVVLARLIKASAREAGTYEGEYEELSAGASARGDIYRPQDTFETPDAGELGTPDPASNRTFGG
jgi:hypothetical protein